jgi:hypothetical protein
MGSNPILAATDQRKRHAGLKRFRPEPGEF